MLVCLVTLFKIESICMLKYSESHTISYVYNVGLKYVGLTKENCPGN